MIYSNISIFFSFYQPPVSLDVDSHICVKHSYKLCQISLQIWYLSWLKLEQAKMGRHQNGNLT